MQDNDLPAVSNKSVTYALDKRPLDGIVERSVEDFIIL
jgi:hypothetical protein